MVEFLSSWAKSLGLAIVIVSILEMLLPNNKTKKYIRMIMGIFVKNKELLDIGNIDLEKYTEVKETSVDQTSMDERILDLYTKELKKDIQSKLEEKGYEVEKCDVQAQLGNEEEETHITKIQLDISNQKENKENEQETNLENKIVVEVQKINPINTNIKNEENTRIGRTKC